MRLTTKSQVTIPQSVRRKLGIGPGSEVEFEVKGKVAFLKPAKAQQTPGQLLVERLRGAGRRGFTRGLTTDEIMAMTRGED
jgi:AbrB family looped-hinge helix DNA binding protein